MTNRKTIWLILLAMATTTLSLDHTYAEQIQDEKPIELSGFSVSQAFEVADGLPIRLGDGKLRKLFYRIQKTSPPVLRKYLKFTNNIDLETIQNDPPEYRFQVFKLDGQVKQVTGFRFPDAESDDPIKGVFLCECVDEKGRAFKVLTLTSPSAWRDSDQLDEPISMTGFLYGTVSDDRPINLTHNVDSGATHEPKGGLGTPLFVAKRLQWFPTRQSAGIELLPSHLQLAQLGVDIGLFDEARKQNTKPLNENDSDLFFQILKAAPKLNSSSNSGAANPIGFTQLMQAPTDHFGNIARFRARVRKCSPVKLTNPELIQRLGFDSYYQLIVFPDLNGLEIGVNNEGGERIEYSRFPVTFCAHSLPDGMQPNQIENKQITVDGIYFRFWKYRSELTDAANVSGQISPLIIGNQPVLIQSDEGTLNSVLKAVILGSLFLVMAIFWFFRSSNLRRPKTKSDVLDSLPDKIDTNFDGSEEAHEL